MLLSQSTRAEILALPGDAILRNYIQVKGFSTVEVEEDGILLDIDTPQDYETLIARLGV